MTTQSRRSAVWLARAVTYFVYGYVVVVEIILGMGFFLLLFGANPSASFVEWIYRSLARAMEPFRGMFTPVDLGTTGSDVPSVFDASILFAMIVYALLAIGLRALIDWLTYRIRLLDVLISDEERPVSGTTPPAPQPPGPEVAGGA